MGVALDMDGIQDAFVAARVGSQGVVAAPYNEHWSGFRKSDAPPEEVFKEFLALFGPGGPEEYRMTMLRGWTADGVLQTGIWGRPDAALYFSVDEDDCHIHVIAHSDSPVLAAAKAFVDTYIEERPPAGTVYMMTNTQKGPEFHSVGHGGAPLDRENYSPEVLTAFDRIAEELLAVQPRGRLTIMSGPPGTGKTYLIRGLLEQVRDALFVVVQQGSLYALLEPSGLAALTQLRSRHQDRPVVLVLEDADDALAPRQEGDTNIMSALLNIGDGITGSVLDIRILATTNRKQQEFDPAILRPGRLSTATEVGTLSVEQSVKVYDRLTGKDEGVEKVSQPMTIAEIYQLAYDAGWKPVKNVQTKRMGF